MAPAAAHEASTAMMAPAAARGASATARGASAVMMRPAAVQEASAAMEASAAAREASWAWPRQQLREGHRRRPWLEQQLERHRKRRGRRQLRARRRGRWKCRPLSARCRWRRRRGHQGDRVLQFGRICCRVWQLDSVRPISGAFRNGKKEGNNNNNETAGIPKAGGIRPKAEGVNCEEQEDKTHGDGEIPIV